MAWLGYLQQNACESNSWRDQGGRVAVAFRLRLRQVGFFLNAHYSVTKSLTQLRRI